MSKKSCRATVEKILEVLVGDSINVFLDLIAVVEAVCSFATVIAWRWTKEPLFHEFSWSATECRHLALG